VTNKAAIDEIDGGFALCASDEGLPPLVQLVILE
jgi:hypothetical protein